MRNKIKGLLLFLVAITASLVVSYIFLKESLKEKTDNSWSISDLIKAKEDNTITLGFVGDLMLDRGVETSVKNNFGGDYNKLFENIGQLKDYDISFLNLEGPVSDKGNNVGSKYSFRMDPVVIQVIKQAGFDVVSFANNHVGDWNTDAFEDTLARLKNGEILYTGAGLNKEEAKTPVVIEAKGTSFCFLGFSDVGPDWLSAKENSPGILLANDPNFKNIIQNSKLKCNIVIVSIHFGEEYKTYHNKRQQDLAHMAIDSGADIIIGHHPHVMEDIEIYKDKIIVYSLGNFIFDQHFSKDTMRGMLFEIKFKDNERISYEQKIITLNKNYQPEGVFTKEEVREKDEIASNVCPTPTKEYKDMILLNVGRETGLSDTTYIPKNLREINKESSTKREICLIKEARNSLEQMIKKAKEDGVTMKVGSGFRSYDYQKNILDAAIKKYGEAKAKLAVALPGHSEHQLGTAIDLTGSSIGYVVASDMFDNTTEDLWLRENAYLYGFIQSYPKGKEDITGYKYEPWHYRYVGIEKAKEIFDSGLTTSEYLK